VRLLAGVAAPLLLGSVAVTVLGGGCSEPKESAVPENTCSDSQGLVSVGYKGTSLGPKQLALTFDDGPGRQTLAISAYLKSRNIPAGFFVNGRSVPSRPTALPGIYADGHVVANHTQNHYDLNSTARFPLDPAGEAALVAEVALTDTLIAPYVPNGRFLFRAPYGNLGARPYGLLHASAMDKYVGQVLWDIGGEREGTYGADWACWENAPQLTSKACGDLHLNEIRAVGRGIVLMHDADKGPGIDNHDPDNGIGNTLDMVKYLVPILEAEGFTFVRIDHVPALDALLPPLPVVPIDAGPETGPDAALDASPDATDASTEDATPEASAPVPDATTPAPPSTSTAPPVSTPPAAVPPVVQGPCPPGSTATKAHRHAH